MCDQIPLWLSIEQWQTRYLDDLYDIHQYRKTFYGLDQIKVYKHIVYVVSDNQRICYPILTKKRTL